uniref:Glutathione S-transferase n=1 Tax=Prorocentrum micans TaxID=2945 RepID=A0A7S2X525_PROMC|mmetsp:Transcript_10074/g.12569  ORF Transcript_10074/g.12569 Transcript_10074/m.12569 type:complete len:187 (-) Transcript_10074:536-1096(-)|eukprot:CAMPEP_0204843120 /NCGR_PEP_ID=MMETSP1346-20131115/47788_1 /ASSEMBLY_ACC=CAM_ASM_000771 /TAXON_ID=215587 /ORGANISM="Aplanochytrium stocchinoi, Strain GSBS06" /LENGTH=186 /DNA_ID=CAMNT_0051982201 /DNA_START=117 /DNA_END=677 /DNA_ORIENTATION=-
MGFIEMIVKYVAPSVGLGVAERYMINNFAEYDAVGLLEPATLVIPRAYGLVLVSNLVGSGITLLALSMKVGAARKKYEVKLPHLYASGNDENSKQFNCVQRGHQQALETYGTYLGCSLVAGIRHPFLTAALGLLWCVSRLKWAEGYATGNPDNRYAHSKWGRHIWTAYLGVVALAISTTCGILGIF